MTAIFEQSIPLQVYQHDILEVITAAPRIWRGHHLSSCCSCCFSSAKHQNQRLSSGSATSRNNDSNNEEENEAEKRRSFLEESVGSLVDGLLTGEHVRNMVQDMLVRIKIPVKKKSSLIYENSYLQPLIEEYIQRHELEKENLIKKEGEGDLCFRSEDNYGRNRNLPSSSSSSHAAAVAAGEEYYAHRVGRLVGILLKPSVASTILANYESSLAKKSNNTNNSTSNTIHNHPSSPPSAVHRIVPEAVFWDLALWTSPSSWQVIVHLGERVETFALPAVMNTTMREDEHRVWVRTCMRVLLSFSCSGGEGSSSGGGVAPSSSSSSSSPPTLLKDGGGGGKVCFLSHIPYLMSGEAAVLKVEQVKRLRHILQYLQIEVQLQKRKHPTADEKKGEHQQQQSGGVGGGAPSRADEDALDQWGSVLMKKEEEEREKEKGRGETAFAPRPHDKACPQSRLQGGRQGGKKSKIKAEEDDDENEDEDDEEEGSEYEDGNRVGRETPFSRKRRRGTTPARASAASPSSSPLLVVTYSADEYEAQRQRLEGLLAEKERHLQQYRQLVALKDREVRNVLQQVRESEAAHGSMLAKFEEKVKQGEKERQELLRSKQQESQQHADQLARASDKLVRMAQLTQKYKTVYEEALSLVQRWSSLPSPPPPSSLLGRGKDEEEEKEGGGGQGAKDNNRRGGGNGGNRQWTVESVLQALKEIP